MKWIKRLFDHNTSEAEPILPQLAKSEPKSFTTVYHRYSFSDPMRRLAVIGDIHGRIDLLRPLAARLDELAQDPTRDLIEIYLGDYIDRAGNSNAVIDFLIERRRRASHEIICLLGNHEQMLLKALDDDQTLLSWLNFGGLSTVLSYGISPSGAKNDPFTKRAEFRAALPKEHIHFFENLSLTYRQENFMFVHAGVRPGVALEKQAANDLLWIRSEFLRSSANFGAIIVHGHTPVAKPEFKPNRINLDTGAYYSGKLTCLTITSENVSILDHEQRRSHAYDDERVRTAL